MKKLTFEVTLDVQGRFGGLKLGELAGFVREAEEIAIAPDAPVHATAGPFGGIIHLSVTREEPINN